MAVAKGPYVDFSKQPGAVCVMANALMGETRCKLREHGVTPTLDRRENVRLHLKWHRNNVRD